MYLAGCSRCVSRWMFVLCISLDVHAVYLTGCSRCVSRCMFARCVCSCMFALYISLDVRAVYLIGCSRSVSRWIFALCISLDVRAVRLPGCSRFGRHLPGSAQQTIAVRVQSLDVDRSREMPLQIKRWFCCRKLPGSTWILSEWNKRNFGACLCMLLHKLIGARRKGNINGR